MAKRWLILNADDYGYNEASNQAIEGLLAQGLITSTSLMTVAPQSLQAAQTAAEKKLPAGVHFTFNSDSDAERWQSNSGAASLSDTHGLHHESKQITLHAKSRDMTCEMQAQVDFMLQSGCKPDHADSHCGTLYGINGRLFFINAFRFCAQYKLPFRLAKSERFLHRMFPSGKAPGALVPLYKGIAALGLRMGVKLPDDVISSSHSIAALPNYETLRDYYLEELRNAGPGITEVFLHPAMPSGHCAADHPWKKREYEYQLLQSGDLRAVAEQEGMELVSWGNAPF